MGHTEIFGSGDRLNNISIRERNILDFGKHRKGEILMILSFRAIHGSFLMKENILMRFP
jgi:hypothetical protein